MSKIIEIRLNVRQGLPNYSSREASVVVVADESESLAIVDTLKGVKAQIEAALGGAVAVPSIAVAEPIETAKPTAPAKVASLPKDHVKKLQEAPVAPVSAAAKSILDD